MVVFLAPIAVAGYLYYENKKKAMQQNSQESDETKNEQTVNVTSSSSTNQQQQQQQGGDSQFVLVTSDMADSSSDSDLRQSEIVAKPSMSDDDDYDDCFGETNNDATSPKYLPTLAKSSMDDESVIDSENNGLTSSSYFPQHPWEQLKNMFAEEKFQSSRDDKEFQERYQRELDKLNGKKSSPSRTEVPKISLN